MTATAAPRFEYGKARLQEFQVRTGVDKKGKTVVDRVEIDGRACKPSPRFWTSLQVRFGFTQNIFRYFRHDEVFNRISEVAPNDQLRFCLEGGGRGDDPTLLAVTNPANACATYDELHHLMGRYGGDGVAYSRGVVRSTHTPRNSSPFDIAGDRFRSKYVIDSPVDGFGRPAIYLSLLRQICSNGAVAYTPVFRSELNVGKGDDAVSFALVRALEGYNNEEGYAALRQRFESATRSWASINEVNKLYKVVARAHHGGGVRTAKPAAGGDGAALISESSPLFKSFHAMTGDLTHVYGLANLDALTVKRQRTLPAGCRVYDLLNFASEAATHHCTPVGAGHFQAFIGGLVSGEYDLEGTVEQFADWKDFFIGSAAAIDTMSEVRR